MTQTQPIDLSIIDDADIKKIQAKKERLDRVMDVIKENGLDKDEKFMSEMEDLIDALIKEK